MSPPGLSHAASLLHLQRVAGNRAVVGLLSRQPAGGREPGKVQRDLTGLLGKKDESPPKKTYVKTRAKDMTSAEGANEKMRVEGDVKRFVAYRDELVAKGMSPGNAARQAFSQAPPNVKRYLPLHSEFDVVKQEIDRTRREEGGAKAGQIAKRLNERSAELGYKAGVGDPAELSPKDAEKELKSDVAFRRQMERRAERLLLGEREAAQAQLTIAKETGNQTAIDQATKKVAALEGPQAVEAKVTGIALDAGAEIDRLTAKKLEKKKSALGKGRLSDAEKWRLREKATKEVRERLERNRKGGLDAADQETLGDVASAAGTAGKVGSAAAGVGKSAGKAAGNLSSAQQATLGGVLGSIGTGFQVVGGTFSSAVKLANKVSDRDSDKGDKDTNIEIAQESLKLVNQAVSGARGSMMAAEKFQQTLSSDPGFAAAIPGLAIAAGVIGFVGNVVAVVPPTERLLSTSVAHDDAKKAANRSLRAGLGRTMVENKLQISTEVVGAVANGIVVAASIAELASAGGFGAPAAVRLGALALNGAKGAADFAVLENLRGETQKARKKGALQIEGSGEKLIKTDIAYAVDTIITAAKKAQSKKAGGAELTAQEANIIEVVASYGVPESELGRLSMAEVHERMLDKLEQDDDQKTVKMKLKEAKKDAEEALAALAGGDKAKEFQDLDSYAKQQKDEAAAKSKMTRFDEAKEALGTVGKYGGKVLEAPLKVTKLGEMASEKSEKVTRLREIKNLVNYKERKDRGVGFAASQFAVDVVPSVNKLRKFIVATKPEGWERLVKELNTLSEQEKMIAKGREKSGEAERGAESVTDRVISPALFARASEITLDEIEAELNVPSLGKADREYLKHLAEEKKA